MEILDFVLPGHLLDQYKDDDENFKVNSVIEYVISIFFEAHSALILFEEHNANLRMRTKEDFFAEREFEQNYIIKNSEKYKHLSAYDSVEIKAIDAKRAYYKTGKVPFSLETVKGIMYAKSFLFSLDNLIKVLESLKKLPYDSPDELQNIIHDFYLLFPGLIPLRNSLHHVEDRIHRKAWKKDIIPKELRNSLISAAANTVISIADMNNNKLCGTAANGDFIEIEISFESLIKVQGLLQRLIDSYKWKGFPYLKP